MRNGDDIMAATVANVTPERRLPDSPRLETSANPRRTAMATKLDASTAVIETLPDPPEKTDMQQDRHYVPVRSALEAHFGKFADVLVAGNGYLVENAANVVDWKQHYYPDCVVAFGVDPEAIIGRNGYVIREVGKPPDFVLEIASETTAPRDETVKREGYSAMGVSEYWRFDGSGKGRYSQPLAGDRLVGGSYRPIELSEEPDGEIRGYSRALSLYLCSDGRRLRLWDPVTREYLPTHVEAIEGQAEAVAERDIARAERDTEVAARIEAERRAAEAEAELTRLRNRLRDS